MKRILLALTLCVAPSLAFSETWVVPLVTARIERTTYSTTLGLRNESSSDVTCTGQYVREDGRVFPARYTVKAGAHRVEPDALIELRAIGPLRLACSGPVAIASRIQSSRDDGLTFDAGSVFAAASDANAVASARTFNADGDLLVLEPDGKPASFTIVAGGVRQSYELPAYTQQHLSVAAPPTRVEVHVRAGRVLVLQASSTKALAALAPRVTREQRVAAAKTRRAQATVATAGAEDLLLCPFKAAPFRDPGTGLCFMRDRWYDPQTGTFLTPDRAGHRDSSNQYAYGRGDPVNRSDPTGEFVETAWDALSLGIGGVSLYHNVREGNYGWAALDALGVAVDTAAVLTPFVPGGAGAALKASRGTGLLAKANLIDQTINVGQGSVQAFNEYREGNLGWGTFYGGMTALGVRGMDASQVRFASRGVGSNFGNLTIVPRRGTGSAIVDPRRLLASASDDFLVGERLVSKSVFEKYIAGRASFHLGPQGSPSFFFNRAGANRERNSLWAGIQAGFTREDLLRTGFEGGNELVRLRFDQRYFDRVAVPGLSRFSDGLGATPIQGANRFFTSNGRVRNMFGNYTFDEFIGPNIPLPAEALLSYEYLGRIIR